MLKSVALIGHAAHLSSSEIHRSRACLLCSCVLCRVRPLAFSLSQLLELVSDNLREQCPCESNALSARVRVAVLYVWVSVNGPMPATSTIIARRPPEKGERPTRPSRDPPRIPTALDGNLIVEACIRHRSLPDSPKTRAPRLASPGQRGYR